MQDQIKKDIKIVNSIIKNINDIKETFEHFGIDNAFELKKEKFAQACFMQFITRLEQDKTMLTKETLLKLKLLNNIDTRNLRNSSSHDYWNVNFDVVFTICTRLIKASVFSELYAVLAELENSGEDNA